MGDSLLAAIEAFCERHRMSETTFGQKAAKDGHLVRRLREGRSITLKRIDKVETFMAEYPPSDDNVSASGDPSDGQEKSARAATRAPQKERAA